jgi:hypothetical protein
MSVVCAVSMRLEPKALVEYRRNNDEGHRLSISRWYVAYDTFRVWGISYSKPPPSELGHMIRLFSALLDKAHGFHLSH